MLKPTLSRWQLTSKQTYSFSVAFFFSILGIRCLLSFLPTLVSPAVSIPRSNSIQLNSTQFNAAARDTTGA